MHYLSDYSTFDNTQELNYHVKQHEQYNTDQLTATMRTVLRFIARYSVKYAGAAHLKVATIAESIDKSDRTVRRVLKCLETLGIIKRIGMIRPKSGGVGANIIQLLPFVSDRLSEREVDDKTSEQRESRIKSGNEPCNKRYLKDYVLETMEAAGARNNIPKSLYEILSPFFYGAELRKYVGIVFRAKSAKTRLETHTAAFTACLIDCIRRYKLGEIRNLDGYIYASIRKLSRKLFLEEVNPLCG
ncbi:helix-turn-helix domain-containing protein [Virgibacillus salexigens]|uniref:Helix-turn-helix domain-containing protein n=1 Tax=Virgibacillus massiliensis TaxID=1462526 RepID=A0A024Q953_9BACI|nr:helix-turn-helix domain-containing protein [Virgibacillus massiliensis]CDQ39058.1 hypothetical protein BN990_01340 [Virgibacillus massiliensis]